MRKQSLIIFLCLSIMIVIPGCSDFTSMNTNPNAPTHVTSSMLATDLILDIIEPTSGAKGFLKSEMFCKYLGWSEAKDGKQYNNIGRASFGGLVILNNIAPMVKSAQTKQLKKSYKALGHFARAYQFFQLTMKVGSIPYSEALKGRSDGIYKPEYDTQKEVFLGILNELEKANRLFAEGANFSGDPIYRGKTLKWQRLVNTFELKVLINLSKKVEDPDLKVKQRFQEIVAQKPIFQSNADNFQIVFSNKSGQKYPWYKEKNNFIIYPMMSNFLLDKLKQFKDRRLFYYASPSPVQLKKGQSASDWEAYVGVNVAAPFSKLLDIAGTHDYSKLNARYSERPEGVPYFLLSYSQLNFILAEAAVRDWIPGTGKKYYKKGIRASMEFIANHTPDDPRFHHNMPITQTYIENYLQARAANFASVSSLEEKVQQIMVQKYISNFLQTPLAPYFSFRRTGYPKFPMNPESNMNQPPTKFPKRWRYPMSEYNHNYKNLKQALEHQYNGRDNVNDKMWLLRD